MKCSFILLCLSALTLPMAAQGKSDVADQLKKMEQERSRAVIKGDTATLDRMTASDYFYIDGRGHVRTKQDTLSAIKSGDIKIESNDLDDLDVHAYGKTAVVSGKSTVKSQIGGQDTSGTYRFMRVYVNEGGQWKSVAFQQTKVAQ
jgi:hypothetical protein